MTQMNLEEAVKSLEEVIEVQVVEPIVVVQFEDSYGKYDFFTDIALRIGNKVVVDTTRGIQVATVVGFKDASKMAYKWVIQKVDMDSHSARIKKEKKKKEIMTKLKAKRKASQELELYRILAQTDPEVAALLDELEGLK